MGWLSDLQERAEERVQPNQAQILVSCPNCGHLIQESLEECNLTHTSDSCEDCGSHGEIYISFCCKKCEKWFELHVTWW